jgi:sulfotransferase family protein
MGKIIWLASYPKSGNTWLRAFLHNLLRDPPESYDINRITAFSMGDSQVSWFRPYIGREPGDWTFEEVGSVRRKAQESMTQAYPDSVFVKTHNALVADHYSGPLIRLELTAGAIYIIRNPLDVAISYSHHLDKTIDETIEILNNPDAGTLNTTIQVYQVIRTWSEHVATWTARIHPMLHVVRYEDMMKQPEQTFGGVAGFLGLQPPRKRLLRAIKRCRFQELRKQEDAHGFKESVRGKRFFREGRVDQWREALTHAQIERIVQAHRPTMQRFGYFPLKN